MRLIASYEKGDLDSHLAPHDLSYQENSYLEIISTPGDFLRADPW